MDSLYITKILAALVSGILGLLSAVSDFRDKTSGNFTKIGRIAIALIVASLIVAIWAEVSSHKKEARDALIAAKQHDDELAKQVEENNVLLRGIQGATMPLADIAATLKLELDWQTSPSYAKRLNNLLKNWKPDDPRRNGFLSSESIAPGVPQTIKGPLNISIPVPPPKDEASFAKSLKLSQAVIAVHRGPRIVTGSLRFASRFRLMPQADGKHIVVEYTAPRVDWSDLRSEDSSLLSFAKCSIDIRPGTDIPGTPSAFELRTPSSHRLQAVDMKSNTEIPPVITGSLSEL